MVYFSARTAKWAGIVLLLALLAAAFNSERYSKWESTQPNGNETREAVEAAAAQPVQPNGSAKRSFKHLPNTTKDLSDYSAVEVVATGYYAGKQSTGKNPGHPEYGITYSGVKVRRDEGSISTIAADPRVFPIGTVLYIPGYGYGVVADTGGAIKGKKIDLYFDSIDQVYKEWGKKTVKVFVVKQGRGKVSEETWSQLRQEITGL